MSMVVNGNFEIKCTNCGKQHLFQPSDSDFQEVSSDTRDMGDEKQYSWEHIIDCDCGSKIEFDYPVWEYPEGDFKPTDIEIVGGTILDEFEIS